MLWEILEITGTVAFAAAGALVGIKKRLDVFGVAMLAVTTAVGGGIIRDTLLGNVPPLAFRNPTFIFLSLIVAILVSLFVTSVARRKTILTVCDAVGLGAFTGCTILRIYAYTGSAIAAILTDNSIPFTILT